MAFGELEITCFDFLRQYGYNENDSEEEWMLRYKGNCNSVIICYTEYEYELSCYFLSVEDKYAFTLDDVLCYMNESKLSGSYMMPSMEQIQKGINNLASVLEYVYKNLNLSDALMFAKVCNWEKEKRGKRLDAYYNDMMLKKADLYWAEQSYNEAYDIYAKYEKQLTKLRYARFEFCKKHRN